MQKSRRWRGLEFDLLSLAAGVCFCLGCAAPPRVASGVTSIAATPAPVMAASHSAPIASTLPPLLVDSKTKRDPAPPARAATPEPAALPLPQGSLVLQIGDSFAAALGGELGKLLRGAGVRSALEYKTASYIPNWSYDGELPKFVASYHPDLVLITLGANEIEIPKPEERAKPIRHLVSTLGGRPCVWVAPPLWKPDTGLLKVIRENIAPCRYLDSNALVHELPRAGDKIHPSLEGRAIWAKMVFNWLARERVGSQNQRWALKPEPWRIQQPR
jgi:lysophospholipase L1-like esterase